MENRGGRRTFSAAEVMTGNVVCSCTDNRVMAKNSTFLRCQAGAAGLGYVNFEGSFSQSQPKKTPLSNIAGFQSSLKAEK